MQYLTSSEAEKKFGYDKRYVAQLARTGKLIGAVRTQYRRNKERWLVPMDELIRYSGCSKGPYRKKS